MSIVRILHHVSHVPIEKLLPILRVLHLKKISWPLYPVAVIQKSITAIKTDSSVLDEVRWLELLPLIVKIQ
ncbi:hypothetical protein Pcinc_022823 [Petrolisthes cinctipes]|uniref:Uncharacterized protein n=1 Tax=Petrolisthes cinctipes TaxID=88211 RepID=A0AAE1FDW6_PETCI|nr:hypothetical protein Pcinc_022823 [Petrolisthes cinctipes]